MSTLPRSKATPSRKSSKKGTRGPKFTLPHHHGLESSLGIDGGILATLSINDEEDIRNVPSKSDFKSRRTRVTSKTNEMKMTEFRNEARTLDSTKENRCTNVKTNDSRDSMQTHMNKDISRNVQHSSEGNVQSTIISKDVAQNDDLSEEEDNVESDDGSSEIVDSGSEIMDFDEENEDLVDDTIVSEDEDNLSTDFDDDNDEDTDYESEYDPNCDSEVDRSDSASDQEDSEDLSFDPHADEIRPAALQPMQDSSALKVIQNFKSTPGSATKAKAPSTDKVKKTKAPSASKVKRNKAVDRNGPTNDFSTDSEMNLTCDPDTNVSNLTVSTKNPVDLGPRNIALSRASSGKHDCAEVTVIVEADMEDGDDIECEEVFAEIVYSEDEGDATNCCDGGKDVAVNNSAILNDSCSKSKSDILDTASSEMAEAETQPIESTISHDNDCQRQIERPSTLHKHEDSKDDILPQYTGPIIHEENDAVLSNHKRNEPMSTDHSGKDDVNDHIVQRDVVVNVDPLSNYCNEAERKPAASSKHDTTTMRCTVVRREGSVKPGKWKLGAKIGTGAFGVVHIGMNTCTGTLMAVKSIKMDTNSMNDAKREIQLMKTLDHKNIVRYIGAEMDAKYLHIFQEWVPAGSVTIMLSKFGPFTLTVVKSYLIQILHGLRYLHMNNILHRDIKGSNILVSDEGIIKLADFGASKRFEQLKQDMMMSLTMRGTPYFMAPEVFEEKYSTKADIWSVGCVAVQMASGNPPWKDLGLTNPVSLFQHVSKSIGPPQMNVNEVDFTCGVRDGHCKMAQFKNLVSCCFERVPENRPCSDDLLDHSFFSEDISLLIDDPSDNGFGLFNSPASASKVAGQTISISPNWATNLSPIQRLPIRRSNSSSGAIRSPMFSPPLPRHNSTSGHGANSLRSGHSPIPVSSPIPDDTEWPAWARVKAIAKPLIVEDKVAEEVLHSRNGKQHGRISDSLVYSDDSNTSMQQDEIGDVLSSPLTGMAFINNA